MSALRLCGHAGFRCLGCVSEVEGTAVLEYVVLTDLLRPGCVLLEIVVAALTLEVKYDSIHRGCSQYSKPINYHSYCVYNALFRLPLRFNVWG